MSIGQAVLNSKIFIKSCHSGRYTRYSGHVEKKVVALEVKMLYKESRNSFIEFLKNLIWGGGSMKNVKWFMGLFLTISILLQSIGEYSVLGDTVITEEETVVNESVISPELQEAFETGAETYRVMIWMEDIDYDKVETMAEKATATTWDTLVACEEKVYADAVAEVAAKEVAESGIMTLSELKTGEEIMADSYVKVLEAVDEDLKLVAEDVNGFIEARRTAAKSLYAVNNQEIVKNSLIAGDIEFVSRYSPMIIAVLTQEQIEAIAEEEQVVGIYLATDETKIVSEEVNGEESGETVIGSAVADGVSGDAEVMAISDYDGYLDYLNARAAHAMGYTGDSVKVGVMDASAVTTAGHNELAGSSLVGIYNAGSLLEPTINEEHSVDMVRIICGDYGMAPDCQVYSNTFQINVFDAAETLLDKGVSVINMSFGVNRESSLYTGFEMWIDHIAVSHSVVVVVAAGNYCIENGYSYNILQPGLAYNTITVANVDYLYDKIDGTSCYINGSAGAMKPDVASAGENVLGSVGGTSAAAATVTGMVAILMEVKPTLVRSPYTVKAIVIASADHLAGSDTYTSSYSSKQGAGVVDVMRAITIINRGQYWSNYISSNGTYSYTKSVVGGSSKTTFVFVGTKMNIGTGVHGEYEYNNQDMPTTTLVIFNSSGTGLGGCGMPNSSVQLVRTSYNSSVKIQLTVSNIGSRGMPYAVAWY